MVFRAACLASVLVACGSRPAPQAPHVTSCAVTDTVTGDGGIIYGAVRDQHGRPRYGVVVFADGPALNGPENRITPDDGRYVIDRLPAGSYKVVAVNADGEVVVDDVRVTLDAPTALCFLLDPIDHPPESVATTTR